MQECKQEAKKKKRAGLPRCHLSLQAGVDQMTRNSLQRLQCAGLHQIWWWEGSFPHEPCQPKLCNCLWSAWRITHRILAWSWTPQCETTIPEIPLKNSNWRFFTIFSYNVNFVDHRSVTFLSKTNKSQACGLIFTNWTEHHHVTHTRIKEQHLTNTPEVPRGPSSHSPLQGHHCPDPDHHRSCLVLNLMQTEPYRAFSSVSGFSHLTICFQDSLMLLRVVSICSFLLLYSRSWQTTYSWRAKSGPLIIFINKVLLGHSLAHSFPHCLWLLSLQQQS